MCVLIYVFQFIDVLQVEQDSREVYENDEGYENSYENPEGRKKMSGK